MNTFKNGDRVSHPTRGEGTVLYPHEGTGWSTVQFDSGDKYMTDTHMLSLIPRAGTLVPRKYNDGDRVSHVLHRAGTVAGYSEHSGLYLIHIAGNRACYALEHQITPAVPEPTYHICISEITGAAHVPGNLTAKQVANYIADNVDWRVVQEIKITKEG